MSQKEYESKVKTMVGHLEKIIPDTTFPIWFFTVNEHPSRATNCHSPYLSRTTQHPCNDVLRKLWDPSQPAFANRVHLLDNTDLLQPLWGDERLLYENMLAVIALRAFVIVGKGVSDWRAVGQAGKVDGLHRNGTVEPNFELVAYTGWS